MKTLLLLLAVVLFSAASFAQPRVSLSAAGGYVPRTLTHQPGAALDAAVNVRWGRALVNLHVAELTYTRANIGRSIEDPVTGELRHERGTEADFDYAASLDANYVQPVSASVALFGGAGIRFEDPDYAEPHLPMLDYAVEIPYLQTGVFIGQSDNVHTVVRAVFNRAGFERVQAGVVVPFRFGR